MSSRPGSCDPGAEPRPVCDGCVAALPRASAGADVSAQPRPGAAGAAVLAVGRVSGDTDIVDAHTGAALGRVAAAAGSGVGSRQEGSGVRGLSFLWDAAEAPAPRLLSCTAGGSVRIHAAQDAGGGPEAREGGGAGPSGDWAALASWAVPKDVLCTVRVVLARLRQVLFSFSCLGVSPSSCVRCARAWTLQGGCWRWAQKAASWVYGTWPRSSECSWARAPSPTTSALSILLTTAQLRSWGRIATRWVWAALMFAVTPLSTAQGAAECLSHVQVLVGTGTHKVRNVNVRAHRRPAMEVDFGTSRVMSLAVEPSGRHPYCHMASKLDFAAHVSKRKVYDSMLGTGGQGCVCGLATRQAASRC